MCTITILLKWSDIITSLVAQFLYTSILYQFEFLYAIIGKTYELPIKDGAINATDLSKIKDEKGEVTRSYDPAYMNTVNCVRSNDILSINLYRFLRSHSLMETREF